MDGSRFDAWTRQTAKPLSRRRSLLTLGGAGLTSAIAGNSVAKAGKRGKQCKKKCQQQESQCEDVVRAFCNEVDPGGNGCTMTVLPCCTPLSSCNAAASTQCFIDKLFTTRSLGAP
jgi:hypothetical protein